MTDSLQSIIHEGRLLLVVVTATSGTVLVNILLVTLPEPAWMQRVTSGVYVFAALWMCSI